jgi:hypothetical protein|tara:strand:+ start:751 stop:933 length:183 start_codon:yes stop_codon:yes gene_type:complete
MKTRHHPNVTAVTGLVFHPASRLPPSTLVASTFLISPARTRPTGEKNALLVIQQGVFSIE